MRKNLRGKLKNAYSVIRKSLADKDISDWISDNFYCIDKHYRQLLKDKSTLCAVELYDEISHYCADRDYKPTPKTLISFLSARRRVYSYAELASLRNMLALCAVISIGESLKHKQDGELRANMVRLLFNIRDPEYDNVLPKIWQPEQTLASFERDYERFDAETKMQYREGISRFAKRMRVSEGEALLWLIEKAREQELPLGTLLFAPEPKDVFIWASVFAVTFGSLLAASLYTVGAIALLLSVPFCIASASVADRILPYLITPYRAPRLELDEIPDDAKTLVAVAALMNGSESDERVFESLQRFRYMNPDKNVYFCLLADLVDSNMPYMPNDNEIINNATKQIDELNREHGERFCMFFRERVLNGSEDKYGGWERKRGAVCELVSHIVSGGKHEYYGGDFIRDIKYLVTLDSDTNLSVGSVYELLSVALHPANRPIVKEKRVASGYGIIQPSVRTELKSAYKTGFSRLISGAGGADVYATASFHRSQSLFGSGCFCGKGLIDVTLFNELVGARLPEGLVLSHDVIEGSILRTLAATDITLTDSTPGNSVSFFRRHHRWLRGDFQNLYFLRGRLLSPFSKARILLTALKHLSPSFSLVAIAAGCFALGTNGFWIYLFAYSEFLLPFALGLFFFLLSGSPFACLRFFSKAYSTVVQGFMRLFFEISSGARRALLTLHAAYLAGYRLITRKKTLEWTTAAQAEGLSSSLGKYVLDGALSAALGLAMLIFARPSFMRLAGLMYFVYPLVSVVLSRKIDGGGEALQLFSEKQKRLLLAHARDMFGFYYENVGERTNHLPPDNIQISPVSDIALRTSPTNIGFYLVSLVAACDMELISTSELHERLEASLSVIERLDKYNGNLYNWYDISSLSVIGDRYVSTVDSGNFLVMLVALKEALYEYAERDKRLGSLARRVEALIEQTDIKVFYDKRRSLFCIGIRGDGKKDGGCYDMLMSEARMTAYYAVAGCKVPKKHWRSLGRTLTHRFGYIGMMSWSGTAFEYFMPQLFLPLYRDSFMYESLLFALAAQRSAGEIWGISESAYYSFDSEMHYQYKANGVQNLALRRIAENEKIIAPYSTYLSLCVCAGGAIKNLKLLENRGMYGKYGLYEALDLNRINDGICVKSYMAHHIGMSIIAIMNAVYGNIFVKRFMADKSMSAANELLQEKIPIDAHIFGDVRDTRSAARNLRPMRRNSTETPDLSSPNAALLSRAELSAVVTSNGHIALSCGERMLANTVFDKYSLRFTPSIIFSRAGKSFGCAALFGGGGYGFEINRDSVSHIVSGEEFSGRVRYSIAKSCNCFVINTRAEALKKYDITLAFEPMLETRKKFLSHISFSRLFIESEYDAQKRILYFHRRSGQDGRHIFSLAVAPRDKGDSFAFLTSGERLGGGFTNFPLDYAFATTDNETGACISPLCLVRAADCDGGKTTFLITCGETKGEIERNIRLARSEREDHPMPAQSIAFPKMLSSVIYRPESVSVEEFSRCGIGKLWSRGISGDHPFAVISISETALTRTDSVISAFLSLTHAFIKLELIFIVRESDSYNRPIEKSLRERCAALGAERYIGHRGGIFILRENDLGEALKNALRSCASFYTDFSGEECRKSESRAPECERIVSVAPFADISVLPQAVSASGNGYFIKDGYTCDKKRLPQAPYSFVLAGKRFATVVTQSSLGYTFFDNARERRLCSFYGDARSLDNGERIFAEINGREYDLCAVSDRVIYEKGKAVYFGNAENISFTVTVTVAPKFPVKLIRVQYPKGVSARTNFYIDPVMGDSVAAEKPLEIKQNSLGGNRVLTFRNTFGMTFPEGFGFAGICGGESDPDAKKLSLYGNDAIFFLGACMTEDGAVNVASRVGKNFFEQALNDAVRFADSLVPSIKVTTKSELTDALMNFFLPYQVAACRFYARGSFYQSGGAYGFRDQLQDCLTLIFSDPDAVRRHIIRCCAHQYRDGSVMHWWHTRHINGVNSGIKSKCSDDMLYLPIVVADYLEKTDDKSVLDVKISYLDSPALGRESERYEYPERTTVKESVYLHCLRALAYAEQKGRHGLILMGSCDWNDAFSLVGERGVGESVFSTLLFIIAAERFIPIALEMGDGEAANHYRETVKELRAAVEKHAFYGDRYARAICDDGTVIGIEQCEECRIDILSQAFAALAGLDRKRVQIALKTAFSKLYDSKNKLFMLFSPPFENGKTRVGYIRGYVAGIRENGGQYTHGALWGALGFLVAGMTEEALTVLECANPAIRCVDKELNSRYKCEPYAIAADIYSGAHAGRGGWSWYTGAAGWFYRIMLEQVLGLRLTANQRILSAKPIIAFKAEITLGSANVHVVSTRETTVPTLDGREVSFPLDIPSGQHILELPISE